MPHKLIYEYFTREHFTLKQFIQQTCFEKKSHSKYIVHTRTDATLHSLPTAKIGHDHDEQIVDVLRKLVHHEIEKITIEHLCTLKNEASVRSVIEIWAKHETVNVFLLIADMCHRNAVNRINFVRCCIDQLGISSLEKKIIIVLHYLPAAFQTRSFYPVLFLDEWQHHFLDGIGEQSESSVGMKDLMLKACLEKKEHKEFDINKAAHSLIKSTLKGVASWNIFYDGQDTLQGLSSASFRQRYRLLAGILSFDLEGATVDDIICRKFASLWTEVRLVTVLKQADHNIQRGNSQLPLTVCLKSILQDAMYQFITYFLVEMNKWRNLDILYTTSGSLETTILFREILLRLPSLPFEELILHRSCRPQMTDLPKTCSPLLFPFFYQISTFLDQVVENVMSMSEDSTFISKQSDEAIVNDVMLLLSDAENDRGIFYHVLDYGMIDIVTLCLETIGAEDYTRDDSLFKRYLSQYITWKLCCNLDSIVSTWFQNLVKYQISSQPMNGYNSSLIFVHVLARRYEIEIVRLACINSWPIYHDVINSSDNLNERCSIIRNKDETIKDLPFQSLEGIDIFRAFVKWFENNLGHLSDSKKKRGILDVIICIVF